ncbi:myb-like protein X [Uloborus diversus]|uniref:myb-like protein X n=1 Tax=Uloborus diversus TaxID=327109 RepID=UPI00240A0B0C|nr:myb-like protein X [Uloborus diversus]
MADYYSQYPEHLNLEEVIKRCHKVNANYLANTANRIKGKSPVRQSPPPTNGTLSSPRSEDNNGSSKENSQSNDSGNENELVSMFQKDKLNKRFDVNSANIRKWVNAKDVEKLTKAVMDGYGDKVVRLHKIEDDEEKSPDQFSELVERINAIHAAVSNDNLDELENQLEEKDFALAKDHMGMTPLHKAVLLRKTKIVGFLIEKFPETINAKNKNGLTALHYAAAMSRKDGQQIYKMLAQAGADSKIRDNVSQEIILERMTAALQKGDVDLLHELVLEGHGKHLLGKSSWNEEAKVFLKELPTYLNNIKSFQESIRIGDVNKVKELVSTNEKLMRARDETGALPFHIAAAAGATQVLHFLGKNFPNMLNVKDAKGRTADSYLQGGKSGHYKAPLNSSSDSMFSSSGKDALEQTNEDISKEDPIDEENASEKAINENEPSENVNNDEDKDLINPDDQDATECNEENHLVNNEEDTEAEDANRKLSTDAMEDVSTEEPVEDKEESEDCIISTDPELQDNEEEDEVPEPGTDEVDELVETLENEAPNGDSENEAQEEINAEDPEVTANENEENKDNEVNAEEVGEGGVEGEEAEESSGKTDEEETEPETVVEVGENENSEEASEEKEEEVIEPPGDAETEDKTDEDNEADPECNEPDGLEGTTEENENAEENEVVAPEENDDADEPEHSEAQEAETTNLLKRHSVSEVTVAEVGSGNVSNIENVDASEEPDTAETEEPAETEEDKEAGENEVEADAKIAEPEECEETSPSVPDDNNDNPDECSNENIPDEEKDVSAVTENEEENNADEVKETDETVKDKDNENEDTATEELEEEKTTENAEENTEETEEEKAEETEKEKTEEAEEEKTEDTEEEKKEPEEAKTEETEEKPVDDEEELVKNEVEENEDEVTEENDGKEEDTKEDEEENIEGQEEKDEQAEKADDEKTNEEDKNEETGPQESEVNAEPVTEIDDIANDGDENKDESSKDTPHQTKDHLDELIEHWIKDGDLLRLEHVVLAGQGDRLIERTSDDKQVQDFLDLVPIYMAKIRAVHEAVAKGHLREVRSVLTRKRFALSRDHVGASPLHLAVLYGHTDVSTYIISHFPETMDGPDNVSESAVDSPLFGKL